MTDRAIHVLRRRVAHVARALAVLYRTSPLLIALVAVACAPDATDHRETAESRPEASQTARQPREAAGGAGSVPEQTPAPQVESATAPSDDAAPAGDAQSPVDVLRAYYRSIDARNYAAAYDAWGSSGPPDQTLDQFARGFSDTARVDVTTGTPSRVEPAAGSRYVQVPVTVTATTKSGATQRFTGTYTLRRSVVDGATEAQRKWHIYRASIERAD